MSDDSFIPTLPDVEHEDRTRPEIDEMPCTCGHLLAAHRAHENETGTRCWHPIPLVDDNGDPAGIGTCPCEQIEVHL